MVRTEDAIWMYQRLKAHGIQVWLTGGWGIDALLGEHTRPHKDLDIIMLLDDVERMCVLLGRDGFDLKMLWSENQQAIDAHGNEVATAFVLEDSDGRQLDAHALRLDEQGDGIPAWANAEEFVFKALDLMGKGEIAGVAVQCITAEMQATCHMGYELPDYQVRDMELLQGKFDLERPDQ
jgi:lincosamide nucleotidyltransferase A/C/D/E